mgnify:FL=1
MVRRASVIGLFCLVPAVAAAVPPNLPSLPPVASATGGVHVEAVLTTIAGHPTAAVPGDGALAFRAATEGTSGGVVGAGGVGGVGVSPDGRRWIVRAAVVDGAGTAGEALIVGEGRHARVAARTGCPAPGPSGVFTSFAEALTIGDDGVFSFRAMVDDGAGVRERTFRGRIGAAGRPVLAPVDDEVAASLAAADLPAVEAAPEEGVEVIAFTLAALRVTPAGDWLARGVDDAGHEWVFRNGEPVALAGAPVTLDPREREVFGAGAGGPAFFSMSASAMGDVAVGGVTEAPGAGRGAAVVLNGQRVLVRAGDPVDLDGDGAANDDAYIDAFAVDGAALGDGGWYYFGATIRNGAGRVIGEGLLRAVVCKPDWDGSGAVDSADIGAFISQWVVSVSEGVALADYNRDGAADTADVAAFLAAWVEAVGGGC